MSQITLESIENASNVILAGVTDRVKKWDGLKTRTTEDQEECEEVCARYLIPESRLTSSQIQGKYNDGFFNAEGQTVLNIDMHCNYLDKHCGDLPKKYMYSYSSYYLISYDHSENHGSIIIYSTPMIFWEKNLFICIHRWKSILMLVILVLEAMRVIIIKYIHFNNKSL